MPSPRPAFAKAVALKSLELAIRFWPEESRHWGRALLAETHEVAHPAAALFWALGGVTVFLRSHFSHLLALLKLPPGRTTTPLPIGTNGPRFPHNSRLVTALILLAVALLLLLPAGREATSIVSSSWRGFEATSRDSRAIEKLAARADQDRDAQMLAFAAIALPDPEEGSRLADRAVSIDPGFVWIYASRFRRPEDTPTNKEWLKQLRNSDPDNAFVYLLSAEATVDSQVETWIDSVYRGARDADDMALSNAEWARWMNLAFQAPRYDSYVKRHVDLTREGWGKAPQLSPSVVAYSVWSHHIPNLMQIKTYANLRVRDAHAAIAVGHASNAEQIINQVVAFGRRMTSGSETELERLVALGVTRRGLMELQSLDPQNGRQREIDAIMAEIHDDRRQRANSRSFEHFRRTALWVQASATTTLFIVLATGAALLWLELGSVFPRHQAGKTRRLTCFVSDYGPPLLLLSAAIFLLSFRPFASLIHGYRAVSSSSNQEFSSWQLWALANRNPFQFLTNPSSEWALWLLLIIGLALMAVTVVVRGIRRHITRAQRA